MRRTILATASALALMTAAAEAACQTNWIYGACGGGSQHEHPHAIYNPPDADAEHPSPVEEQPGDQGSGDAGTGDQGSGDAGTGDQGSGDAGTGDQGTSP